MKKKVIGYKDTIEWYNENAEQYANSLERVPNIELLDKFAEILGRKGTVLNAGCAGGRDTKLLRDRGLDPIGVDVSKPLLKVARRRYPDINFINADFLHLPFKDQEFDGVWAHASLVHFETIDEVKNALSEFYRVLKEGGTMLVFVKEQQVDTKTEVVSDALSGHDRFFRWFVKDELNELVKHAGFKIEEIEKDYKDPAGRDEVKWIVAIAKK